MIVCIGSLVMCDTTRADEGVDFFEKKIRPVLIKHCYECHSASAEEVKGELRLDSRAATRKGGETGPAIVPGKAAKSLLLEAIRHESLEMPPDKKLPDVVIADFERWVAMGAPDPRDRPPTASEAAELSWQATLESRRGWWSMQPVGAVDVPRVENEAWSSHAIDRFILNKLEQAALAPGEPAEPRPLIRRLSLVLTGLPSSPAEIDEFLAEHANDPEEAYDGLVDRLLRSPHFGERWARHWMDVVRYTETHGNEWNYEVHHAWRYRDYLIRALNNDVPYDQLLREHIAGDLLAQPRWNEADGINESVIGTAFYRFGEVNHDDCIGLRQIGFDLVDNRIDTLTKAFQATTVACARCHDHKIDAVSTKDYYALLGILRSSRLVAHTIDSPSVNVEPMRKLAELKVTIREQIAERWLADVENVARYLVAADAARRENENAGTLSAGLDPKRVEKWVTALKVEKPSIDDPLSPWLALDGDVAEKWSQQREHYTKQQQVHAAFNEKQFSNYADFRNGTCDEWKSVGHGLRQASAVDGEFCISSEDDSVIGAILPAGRFTHALSQKLNGALRSPILVRGKKHLSFQVLGEHTSALRLVSNNCQLNYQNYRALTSDTLEWITFSPPEELDNVRVYAELMTKFNNPKFPDQLGTLGGDTKNDRVPWKEAAADPRSYFGITRVVAHDCTETPKPEVDHLVALFADDQSSAPQTLVDVAKQYARVIERAIQAWKEGRSTRADVRWLDWLIKNSLLDNSAQQTPELTRTVAEYRSIEQNELQQPRLIPGVEDLSEGFDQPLLVRGDCMKPGEVVQRRYLEVLNRPGDTFSPRGSGRLELAEQIASPNNPLTARVMVNRVWHHLFGSGIVRTVDDFGHVGELPSHPELLDFLANRFIDGNWSIKTLIREIVRTNTFRMASRAVSSASEIDPENRLLHHYPARRLDAEAIRDVILVTSGRLDRTLFGLSVRPYREKANVDRRLFTGPLDGDGRRSVYTKVSLMEGPKFLETFNFPGSKVTQGRRDVTNVPTQALALLNDPFVIQQAGVWAKRHVEREGDATSSRLERMHLKALGRRPTDEENQQFEQLIDDLASLYQVPPEGRLSNHLIWKDVSHVIFNLKEFIFIP